MSLSICKYLKGDHEKHHSALGVHVNDGAPRSSRRWVERWNGWGIVTFVARSFCTGRPISGYVNIADDVADRRDAIRDGETSKAIALRKGERICFGSDTPLDADGYPTTIDTSSYLTRQ